MVPWIARPASSGRRGHVHLGQRVGAEDRAAVRGVQNAAHLGQKRLYLGGNGGIARPDSRVAQGRARPASGQFGRNSSRRWIWRPAAARRLRRAAHPRPAAPWRRPDRRATGALRLGGTGARGSAPVGQAAGRSAPVLGGRGRRRARPRPCRSTGPNPIAAASRASSGAAPARVMPAPRSSHTSFRRPSDVARGADDQPALGPGHRHIEQPHRVLGAAVPSSSAARSAMTAGLSVCGVFHTHMALPQGLQARSRRWLGVWRCRAGSRPALPAPWRRAPSSPGSGRPRCPSGA